MNKNDFYKSIADRIYDNLLKNPQVEAVCFLGGLGKRNYLDQYSDIDIAVFVNHKNDGISFPDFSFSIPKNGRLIEINLSQHSFDEEGPDKWNNLRKSAYQNASIVFDKEGRLKELIEKYAYEYIGDFENLVKNINQIWWLGVYHAYASFKRGYQINAQLLINQALSLSCESIEILRGNSGSHLKWFQKNITRQEDNLIDLIHDASICRNMSEKEIIRRIRSISKIRKILQKMSVEKYPDFPAKPYFYWAKFISHRSLGDNKTLHNLVSYISNKYPKKEILHKKFHGIASLLACRGDISFLPLINELKNANIDEAFIKTLEADQQFISLCQS